MSFEFEMAEQQALIVRLPTHHGKPPPLKAPLDGILFAETHGGFFNTTGQKRALERCRGDRTEFPIYFLILSHFVSLPFVSRRSVSGWLRFFGEFE
jgi:hypothetical protein